MKSKIVSIIFIMMLSGNAFSQTFSKNSLYYEAYGHTRTRNSLNYERYICPIYKNIHLNGRIGIGYYKYYNIDDIVTAVATIIPAVASIEYGKKRHFVNLGAGYSISFINKRKSESEIPRFDSAYSFSIGYKYMDVDGLFIQIYPVVIYPKISEKEISAGISLGFSW